MKSPTHSPHSAVRNTLAQPLMYAATESDTSFREAVGLFPDMATMQDAIRELEGSAFQRDSISVLGSRHELERVFGTDVIDPVQAKDNPLAPRQAPSRPEEENIGAGALVGGVAYLAAISAALMTLPLSLPVTLAAVALGGGGGAAIGMGIVTMLGHRMDENVLRQIDQGGLILWVRTPDAEHEAIALDIMRKHGAHHIQIHDMTV